MKKIYEVNVIIQVVNKMGWELRQAYEVRERSSSREELISKVRQGLQGEYTNIVRLSVW